MHIVSEIPVNVHPGIDYCIKQLHNYNHVTRPRFDINKISDFGQLHIDS